MNKSNYDDAVYEHRGYTVKYNMGKWDITKGKGKVVLASVKTLKEARDYIEGILGPEIIPEYGTYQKPEQSEIKERERG